MLFSVHQVASIFQNSLPPHHPIHHGDPLLNTLLCSQPLDFHIKSIRDFIAIRLPFFGFGYELFQCVLDRSVFASQNFAVKKQRWSPRVANRNSIPMPPTPSRSPRLKNSGTPSPRWMRGLRPFTIIRRKVTSSGASLTTTKSASQFSLTSSGIFTPSSTDSSGVVSGTGGTAFAGRRVPQTPSKPQVPPQNVFRRRLRRKLFKSPCRHLK